MSADAGLDVVLTWLDLRSAEILAQARADVSRAKATSGDLDELELRVARLRHELDLDAIPRKPPSLFAREAFRQPAAGQTPTPEWAAIRLQAEASLRERGMDPRSVDLDDLLDPEEARRIERRFSGDFMVQAHLDRYDIAMIAIAGLAAALVGFLIVKIPKDVVYLGAHAQTGSPLTKLLQSHSVGHDNWLSDWAKVSYDRVNTSGTGIIVLGSGPRTHRQLTFGHDPLLGLVVGVIDIMRGGMTAIDKCGQLQISSAFSPLQYNPLMAFVLQIAHVLSDAFTPMGVPPPGWTLLNFVQAGSFGVRDRTVADLARWMYTRGYDSRHFLTMSTSVAAIEIVLRGYWALRKKMDPEFAEDVQHAAAVAGSTRLSAHPRFQAMAFGAYAAAVAANCGKIAVYQGNPLAINYAEWLGFMRATFLFARGRAVKPNDLLIRQGLTNAEALSRGWPALDVDDPTFPTITLRPSAIPNAGVESL